jgi:4-amino-4-deoxy-L-arabinose transferase-like glycosyltransferase/membrane-associated phospholipid phosphatase
MDWIQAIDTAVFRLVNTTLSHPVLDWLMPAFSSNSAFVTGSVLVALAVIWKGGPRSRLCVAFVLLVVAAGDSLICNPLKDLINRPRPFLEVADAITLGGRGATGSMPSSHAANWFAAATVLFVYYRRSLAMTLPLAMLVGFSRVYTGMHYPGDVLAGALMGIGYTVAGMWLADQLWRRAGHRAFPHWAARYPSLLRTKTWQVDASVANTKAVRDAGAVPWLRFGYLLIGALLLLRLGYIASDTIDLSEDEAYQWLWSKRPALSYYSKPPLIAGTQWLGTAIWGDTKFGVRFFAPLIAAGISLLVLRFLAREVNPRAAFWTVFALAAAPMMSAGAVLMTIDPLNVLFWTAAMIAGWRAVQADSTRWWALTGLLMGLSFLSKYTGLFQFLSWAVFFALWQPARAQLARPGPWLAVALTALCSAPVLVWNAQHDWITVTHLTERGGLAHAWRFQPKFIWDFIGAELVLLNPVFCLAAGWAAIAVWRRHRDHPLAVYLFSMGVPLVLVYLLWTLRARVQPNWIAPAVVPLFMLMALHWDGRWRAGVTAVREWLRAGLIIGLFVVIVLHDTNLLGKITGHVLPARIDPLRRVRGWHETATQIEELRARLEAEGRPAFIITGHYGLAGQLSFHIPAAREGVPDDPLVFYKTAASPENQFYFWPGYESRKGHHAIYVQEEPMPRVPYGLDEHEFARPWVGNPPPARPPEVIENQFASVRDLGIYEMLYRHRPMRYLRVFECRELR